MRPLLLALFLLFGTSLIAQQRIVRMQHYHKQLNRLKDATLIVELPASPTSTGIMSLKTPEARKAAANTEVAKALFNAFNEEYSYSNFLFSYPGENGRIYIAQDKTETEAPADTVDIFYCKYVEGPVDRPEIYYEVLSDNKWTIDSAYAEKKKDTEYGKRMDELDPEVIAQGGLIIYPKEPYHEKVSKKKRISSEYIYRSRTEPRMPVDERFRSSVSYLERKLKTELPDYNKKFN